MTTGHLAHWDSWFHELDQHLECSTSRSKGSGCSFSFVLGFVRLYFAQHGIMGAVILLSLTSGVAFSSFCLSLMVFLRLQSQIGWIRFCCGSLHSYPILMVSNLQCPEGLFQEFSSVLLLLGGSDSFFSTVLYHSCTPSRAGAVRYGRNCIVFLSSGWNILSYPIYFALSVSITRGVSHDTLL